MEKEVVMDLWVTGFEDRIRYIKFFRDIGWYVDPLEVDPPLKPGTLQAAKLVSESKIPPFMFAGTKLEDPIQYVGRTDGPHHHKGAVSRIDHDGIIAAMLLYGINYEWRERLAPVPSIIPRETPFHATLPSWVNTRSIPLDGEQALKRTEEISALIWQVGIQSGVHSLIEWCGVLAEHVKMLRWAHTNNSEIDVRELNQHSGQVAKVPSFMVGYLTEKLGCQLKPFIRADPKLWRKHINKWFEET